MNEAELEAYLAECVEVFQERNRLLETRYGIGHFARWDVDGEALTLTFSDPDDDAILVADITQLGTYSLNTNTWLWAWANESNTAASREQSAALRSLADTTGLRLFGDAHHDCDEFLAWELAAAAARHLDALGIYRCPADHLWSFCSIDRVTQTRRTR